MLDVDLFRKVNRPKTTMPAMRPCACWPRLARSPSSKLDVFVGPARISWRRCRRRPRSRGGPPPRSQERRSSGRTSAISLYRQHRRGNARARRAWPRGHPQACGPEALHEAKGNGRLRWAMWAPIGDVSVGRADGE